MRDIPGFEGLYAVTDDGRVWAHPRGVYAGQWMAFNVDRKGYYKVHLSKGGKHRNHFVHRLVALAYLPNPHGLPQINHCNGIRTDNNTGNLEWVTAAQNIRHAIATGLTNTRTPEKQRTCRENIVKARAALAEKRGAA